MEELVRINLDQFRTWDTGIVIFYANGMYECESTYWPDGELWAWKIVDGVLMFRRYEEDWREFSSTETINKKMAYIIYCALAERELL